MSKYLRSYTSDGVDYHYVIKGRGRGAFRVRLTAEPGSPLYWRQYSEALAQAESHVMTRVYQRAGRAVAGTIGELLENYFASADFKSLKPISQRVFRLHLADFEQTYGLQVRKAVTPNVLRRLLASKSDTPAAAANLRKRLRSVYRAAEDAGLIDPRENPTLGVRAPRYRPGGLRAWSEDDVSRFVAKHPPGTTAHTALVLALETGQRRADLARLGPSHLMVEARTGVVGHAVLQQKGGNEAFVPLTEALAAVLMAGASPGSAYLATQYGRPFTAAGLGNAFAAWAREAGVTAPLHGLRKLALTRLLDRGATTAEAMAISGHKSIAEFERYVGTRNHRALAVQAMQGRVSSFTNYTASRTKPDHVETQYSSRFFNVVMGGMASPTGFEPVSPP